MADTKNFFLTVAQRIFSNWTALKLAVELNGKRTDSRECAIEFCSFITEVLYMNEKLTNGDVASVLEDYMEEQFNTEMMDGSAMEVAEELLRFHRYCVDNQFTAMTELEKLPPLQPWLLSVQTIRSNQCNNHSVPAESDNSSDEDTEICTDAADTEWTVVTNRRKR